MLNIGCHLSISRGFANMGREAVSIDANTCQFFTRNPRGSKAKAIDPDDIRAMQEIIEKNNFAPLLGHAPYTMNPCSPDPSLRELARDMMADDIVRMENLPGQLYNFHPGSHVGQGLETGIRQISECLDSVLRRDLRTAVLLEAMSGKGSEIGSSFAELKQIIDAVMLGDLLGVCIDTCHIYAAGYDIVNNLDEVLEDFDQQLGLARLKAIHLNDSMTPFASRKDRHARLGEGTIGLDAIINVINHPALKDIPFFLETPNEVPGYAEEIRILREAYEH